MLLVLWGEWMVENARRLVLLHRPSVDGLVDLCSERSLILLCIIDVFYI